MNRKARSSGFDSLLVMAICAIVFWRTAYPTINWWDSAEYSLAARTLGIAHPPGSLLLTLLGAPIAALPIGSSPAYLLNLFAGALAAVTAGLMYVVAIRLLRCAGIAASAVGAGLGVLTVAFGPTLWEYAVQFTPYVLTAVLTGLLLWALLRWWEDADRPEAWRWIALLGLLFGLDFSVHRTNALLIPGALVWVLVRSPRTLRSGKSLLAGIAGLAIGLAVQLLIIPIATGATTRSPLFWSAPDTWSRFRDYLSLAQFGSGNVLQILPRKADLWSVQVADLLRVLGANFLHWRGPTSVLGVLPAVAALVGLTALWRKDRRLGWAYVLVLLLQAAMTVLVFNIPAGFFRTFDRHYLPICVTIAALVACGLATALQAARELARQRRWVTRGATAALAVAMPLSAVVDNWTQRDASRRYFAREFATNLLNSLPDHAILFTVGDNDTFPLLYFQGAEGVRRDVTIINLSVANLPGFPEELRRREPAFPLSWSAAERDSVMQESDTTKTYTVGSVSFAVKPQYGAALVPSDVILLDIVRSNHWRRPLCFATTVTRQGMGGYARFGRLDGLYYRMVPAADPQPDPRLIRSNLLEHADYRGYADASIPLDETSRNTGFQSYVALTELLEADRRTGDFRGCRTDLATLFAVMPPDRMSVPSDWRAKLESKCRELP